MQKTAVQEATEHRVKQLLSLDIYFEEDIHRRVVEHLRKNGIELAGLAEYISNTGCLSLDDLISNIAIEYQVTYLEKYVDLFSRLMPI